MDLEEAARYQAWVDIRDRDTYISDLSDLDVLRAHGCELTGVVSNGIAVFDFNATTVGSNQVFVGSGSSPLALLSRGDVTVNGTIDVSGGGGGRPAAGSGGPGGGSGGEFPGPGGGPGSGGSGVNGGGGFGGPGGPSAFGLSPGSSYGNLALSLQGGSGGGASIGRSLIGVGGGGGGGAVEIGALGSIVVGGRILANGGAGVIPGALGFGSGGGSGGGIFLHGDSVALLSLSVLNAMGGFGGGGRVLIQAGPGGFTGDIRSINVSGSGNGQAGVFAINVVPEPASLVLLGIGLLGVLGCAGYAGRRAAA